MRRLLAIPLGMIALLMAALAWSGGGVNERADFTFVNRGDVYTLDLNQMSYTQDFRVTYGIREGLYAYDPTTFRPTPSGATGHELSDDKRVWTFRLRPEARWTNGDRVTAHDYAFSWRRMLEDPGEYTYLFYYIKGAEAYEGAFTAYNKALAEPAKPGAPKPAKPDFKTVGIEVLDDLTLRVSLSDPVTYLLDLLAFPPFYPRNERSMEPFKEVDPATGRVTYRADYTRPPVKAGQPGVVTNGPFTLTDWQYKRRLILEKSPSYWDRDNVLSNRVEMVVNDNPLSQYLAYETGELDWVADVPATTAAEMKAKGRTDLRTSPAFGTAFLTFLCQPELPESVARDPSKRKNPLADVRVRQALTMAVDRRFITENITRMGELPARTYLPPDGTLDFRWLPGPFDASPAGTFYAPAQMRASLASPGGLADKAGPGLPYDVELARKLLAEAGYPNGAGFPPLPILINSDNQTRASIAQAIKDQWKRALNIDVGVQQIEGKIFKERCSKKDYAIATVAWYGDYPDASTFTDKYLSTSLQNDSDWRNPAFDALCAKAAKEGDAAARVALLSQAEHLIDTEVPVISLYHYTNISLNRDNVEGVAANPRNLTVFKRVRVNKPGS
jgi:oligopeptide transport system substrate-binding protein